MALLISFDWESSDTALPTRVWAVTWARAAVPDTATDAIATTRAPTRRTESERRDESMRMSLSNP